MGLRLSLIYELVQNALIRTTGDCYPLVDKSYKSRIMIKNLNWGL